MTHGIVKFISSGIMTTFHDVEYHATAKAARAAAAGRIRRRAQEWNTTINAVYQARPTRRNGQYVNSPKISSRTRKNNVGMNSH